MNPYAEYRVDAQPILRAIESCVARAKAASASELRLLRGELVDLFLDAPIHSHGGARLVRKVEFSNPHRLREIMKEHGAWRDSRRRKAHERMERFARKALFDGTIGDDVAFFWFDAKIEGVD